MNDELLQKAIQCTNIQDIYLDECKSAIYNNFEPKLPNQNLLVQFKIGTGTVVKFHVGMHDETEMSIFRVQVQVGARFMDSDFANSEKTPELIEKYIRAEITAKFIAEYQITCDDLSDEAINEFSKRNATFHVWPYWREFLHSTAGRMKLPEVVLPMYSLPKGKKENSENVVIKNEDSE